MIRFIFAALWVILFLIASIPLFLIEFLIGLKWPKARAKSSQKIVGFAFKMVTFFAGTKIIVKGLENIPESEAVLFVPNHRSIFDVVITYPIYPHNTAFVAKKETKKVPLLSTWMALMDCQFLDRKDLREGLKIVLKSAELIKSGTSVTIFPEGTRNKTEDVLIPFHEGSFKIAEKAECPIIPVAINNSEQVFEAQFPKLKKTTVVVEFLKPINAKGLSKEEKKQLSTLTRESITEAYLRNKELV